MRIAILAAGSLALASSAFGVIGYQGAQIVNTLGSANFNALGDQVSIFNYQEGGLTVSMDHISFQWTPPGFDGTHIYYPNSGDFEQTIITRTDGQDFQALEFQVGDGWAHNTNFIWGAAYLNGVLQDHIDIDITPSGSIVGFRGVFDEIRVAGYFDANERNAHNPSGFQAIAIDNMRYGLVPTPGAGAALGLAVLAAGRRRR